MIKSAYQSLLGFFLFLELFLSSFFLGEGVDLLPELLRL